MNALKVTVSPIATDLFTALHVCAFGVYVERYTTNVWINTADEKLYEGKNSGKNRVVV
jgi:PleD family two-component response regulator